MYDEFENDITIFYNFIKILRCYNCGTCIKENNKNFTGCYCDKLCFFSFENVDRYSIFLENYYLIVNIFKPVNVSKTQCFIFDSKSIKKIFEFDHLPDFIISFKNDSNINYAEYLENKIINLLDFK